MTKLLALAAMDKILKRAGAGRVSEQAKISLQEAVEKDAGLIAEKAVKYAWRSGRKTVKKEDIVLALK